MDPPDRAETAISRLRSEIKKLKIENFEEREFFPFGKLRDVIRGADLETILRECNVPSFNDAEFTRAIKKGGFRFFSLLVHMNKASLIDKFIAHGGTTRYDPYLDSKLPYERDGLKSIIGDDCEAFCKAQWMFSAPIFAPNHHYRALKDDVVLPFLREASSQPEPEPIEGGYATVDRVTLPEFHHGFPGLEGSKVRVVRKILHPSRTVEMDFKHEQHILSLLRCLRHPNIVPFYTAYKKKTAKEREDGIVENYTEYTLLFEPADRDLKDLFKLPRPPEFTDEVLLRGMHGLSSAISELHDYNFPGEQQMIGCHYDIKPRNILVRGTRFLVSDFGLSRLKVLDDGSKSNFKGGAGDYLAPECQDLDGNLQKNRIGRKSDVWSFGCVLADVGTYMQHGSDRIGKFRNKRRHERPSLVLHQYHHGDEPSKDVEDWLTGLEEDAKAERKHYRQGLIAVIRPMLAIQPSDRPEVSNVCGQLFLLSLRPIYESILELLDGLGQRGGLSIVVQRERLKKWVDEVGLLSVSKQELLSSTLASVGMTTYHDQIYKQLCGIRDDLYLQASQDSESGSESEHDDTHTRNKPIHPSYLQAIRTRIDVLWDSQPDPARGNMNRKMKDFLLTFIDRDANGDVTSNLNEFADVQRLICIKQILASLEKLETRRPGPSLRAEAPRVVGESKGLDSWSRKKIRYIAQPDGTRRYVFFENLEADERWSDAPKVKEGLRRADILIAKVHNLVAFLQKEDVVKTFPVLRCRNFCHIPDSKPPGFGLIFDIPDGYAADGDPPKALTLASLMRETRSRSRSPKRPLLGDVLWLAHKLAVTLVNLHRAGWFHKAVSSSAVVFFVTNQNDLASAVTSPYLVDFHHAREGNAAITVGPPRDLHLRRYLHPDYIAHDQSNDDDPKPTFKPEFDYYGLGIVLLELGRWTPLQKIVPEAEKSLSACEFRERLLAQEVPQLGSYMGRLYQDAVHACIEGTCFAGGEGTPWSTFEEKVVQPLARCLALYV